MALIAFRKITWSMAFFTAIIGMNAITIYIASKATNFTHTADFLFTYFIETFSRPRSSADLCDMLHRLLADIPVFLYRQKMFLRV